MKNRRGEILVENLIFIILNVVFLSILIVFLLKQGSGVVLLEDTYSKQIALLIDSAKPGTVIQLNMERGLKAANKKGVLFKDVVLIEDNYVTVKLSERSGFSYPFFNDVHVEPYSDSVSGEETGTYVFTISRRQNE